MKYLFWLLIFLFLASCKHPESSEGKMVQKPDSLISREHMIRILTDVHLAEASLAFLKSKGEVNQNLTEDYYNAIFSKYKISSKRFTMNFNYYKSDQADFLKMYDKVIKNLEEMKSHGKPKQ